MLVMDPLSAELAHGCIVGYAQRNYGDLAQRLSKTLGRRINVSWSTSLAGDGGDARQAPDLIIGDDAIVRSDAKKASLTLTPLALLTGRDGRTTQRGLFVVRDDDPAGTLGELKGRKVLFGPAEHAARRSAAVAAMTAAGLAAPQSPPTVADSNSGALAVAAKEADAAVLIEYALPLILSQDVVAKGALRIVGKTAPMPFITAFATDRLTPEDAGALTDALTSITLDKTFRTSMETWYGFVRPGENPRAPWGDWRGPDRNGICDDLPHVLGAKATFLWRSDLAAKSVGALSATTDRVIVSDKSELGDADAWRCFDGQTGKELWTLTYPAEGEMDYTNAPRAAAVVEGNRVYLLSAFGDLYCVRLDNGKPLWSIDFKEAFAPRVPTWGYCASPLIVDDKLIVSTTAPTAAVVALDKRTGKVIWKTPGNPPGYGAMILGRFGGVRQIVGHDRHTLGGWDPETGKRLWTLKPPEPNDYNVPTPVDLDDGRLLVATENNGTRIYAFNSDGTIVSEPTALNEDLLPDSGSPVVLGGRVWGIGSEGACCLDLGDKLKTLWLSDEAPLDQYATFIGGNGRVLIIAKDGRIGMMPSRPGPDAKPQWLRVFGADDDAIEDDAGPEVWSHPAIVGNRLYLRSRNEIVCLLLSP